MPHFKLYVLLKILIHTQSKMFIPFLKQFDVLFNVFQNNQFMLSWKSLSHIQDFKKLWDGSSGLLLRVFSDVLETLDVQHFRFSTYCFFENYLEISLNSLELFGGPKVKNNWLWRPWSRPLGPKRMKMMTCRLSQSEIEKLLVQNEAE